MGPLPGVQPTQSPMQIAYNQKNAIDVLRDGYCLGNGTGDDGAGINAAIVVGHNEHRPIRIPGNGASYKIVTPVALESDTALFGESGVWPYLVFAGTAGAQMMATSALTGESPNFTGKVVGLWLQYPYALLASGSAPLYVANPSVQSEFFVLITTDEQGNTDYPPVAGSYGVIFDGLDNNGPFSARITANGQFQAAVKAACDHLTSDYIAGAYGMYALELDDDSIGDNGYGPTGVDVRYLHGFNNTVAGLHIIRTRDAHIGHIYQEASTTGIYAIKSEVTYNYEPTDCFGLTRIDQISVPTQSYTPGALQLYGSGHITVGSVVTSGYGMAVGRTWKGNGGTGVPIEALQPTAQNFSTSPTGTTSTSLVMAGLAVAFTPQATGNVKVSIVTDVSNGTSNDSIEAVPAYGTGTAPTNGAPAAGTTFGPTKNRSNNLTAEMSWAQYLTGLTVGTAYWFDLQFAAITGGEAYLVHPQIVIEEI